MSETCKDCKEADPPVLTVPVSRPPEPIPADYDVEHEKRRTKQGGCCGKGTA